MTALVGPLFVDWTAYRAAFERQATEILGHRVRVTGTADASILPVPTLAFTDVVIGDAASPMMTVARFNLEVELFPLLSGEIRVTQMRLDRPNLTVRVSEDGAFEWIAGDARAPADPKKVVLDRVDIVDGTVTVADARHAAPIEIADVNALLDARSLVGPYKIDGSATVGGERVMVRISTGEADANGGVTVKGAFSPVDRPVALGIDGRLATEADQPRFEGTLALDRVVAKGDQDAPATPWSVTAAVTADAARAVAKTLELRYGPEDRPFSITGSASLDYAFEPLFEAVLSARQIDLDRTLGAGPDKPVAFGAVLDAVSAALRDLPEPPVKTRIGLDVPGIVVGGSLIQSLRLDATSIADGWDLETLEAQLPGRTTLKAQGPLVNRPYLSFAGDVVLASEQPATLVSWWNPGRPATQLEPFSGRATTTASAAGLRLDGLEAGIGDARVTGSVAYTPARADGKARVVLALDADRLEVEQARAVAALFAAGDGAGPAAGADVDVTLTAATLVAGTAEAKGVEVRAALADGTLAIDRMAIADLAGAELSAAGTVANLATTPDGSIEARITAERLDGVTALLKALAPNAPWLDALATAAPVLAPAALQASVEARAGSEATDLTVKLGGTAGGTQLDGALAFAGRIDRWTEGTVRLDARAEGPNGARLMRQLGFDVADTGAKGAGRLVVSADGTPADGLAVTGSGALGATEGAVDGTVTVPAADPASAALSVRLKSDDATPLLALAGGTVADLLGATPVDLSASLSVTGPTARLSGLTGRVGGGPVDGDLTADFAADQPRLSGTLRLADASLEGFGDLALGPGALSLPFVTAQSPWPETPFGTGALDGVDTDIALTVDRLSLDDALTLDAVTLAVRNSQRGLAFDEIKGRLAGGTLAGSVVVKRDLEGQAAVDATFKLEDAPAEAFAWRRGDRAVVAGRLGADLDLQASGRTVSGLVASLNGGGALRITDGVLRSMNPAAFSAVVRAADAGLELTDDKIREVFTANVDAGDLAFDRLEGAFTVSSGTLRAPTLAVTAGSARTTGSATVDLPRWRLESDWQLTVDAGADAVAGAVPQVAILFRGPVDAPSRTVDVTAFTAYLTLRSFEAEVQRVEIMQADIQERELLRRTLQRSEDAAIRRRKAAVAEARRIAEEEARRAAEEAARQSAPPETLPEPAPQPDRRSDARSDKEFADDIARKLQSLGATALPPLPSRTVGPAP